MKAIIINPHSFVDVITNSSTELFVCDTKKEISFIKEALKEMLKLYNKLHDAKFTYKDCFKDPVIVYKNKVDVVNNLTEGACYGHMPKTKKDALINGRKHKIEYDFVDKYDIKQKSGESREDYLVRQEECYKNVYKKFEKDPPDWWDNPFDDFYDYDRLNIEELHGKILIFGASDNSIPYDLFELIQGAFGAERYHLG